MPSIVRATPQPEPIMPAAIDRQMEAIATQVVTGRPVTLAPGPMPGIARPFAEAPSPSASASATTDAVQDPTAQPATPVAPPLAIRSVPTQQAVAPVRYVDAAPAVIVPSPAASAPATLPARTATADPVALTTPTPAPFVQTPASPALSTPVAANPIGPMPVAAPPSSAPPLEPRRPSFVREVASPSLQAVALPPQSAPAPAPGVGVTAPAIQLFGAAMRSSRSGEELQPGAVDATAAALATPGQIQQVVAPSAGADQPALDLTQQRWPQAMIDHIERLRDAADANDTRIRLIPDALGTIDVALRRDGDTVHVHFNAEQAATRTLLQDAQPQLAQAAEQRGLKLGQTVVEAGTTGTAGAGQQQPQQQQARQAPLLAQPARAQPLSHDEDDTADAGRLA